MLFDLEDLATERQSAGMGHLNQLVDDGSAQPAALSLGEQVQVQEVQIAGLQTNPTAPTGFPSSRIR